MRSQPPAHATISSIADSYDRRRLNSNREPVKTYRDFSTGPQIGKSLIEPRKTRNQAGFPDGAGKLHIRHSRNHNPIFPASDQFVVANEFLVQVQRIEILVALRDLHFAHVGTPYALLSFQIQPQPWHIPRSKLALFNSHRLLERRRQPAYIFHRLNIRQPAR